MINKDFYTRAKELADSCNRVKGNKVYETLAKEFHIRKRNARDRFKSLFGKCVRDYISNNIIPTREQMRDAIIKSSTHDEMCNILNVNRDLLKGLYDKYFGYSTYFKCKICLLNEIDVIQYNPTIEDNYSLFISQWLGDGYFDFTNNRSCLSLEHCEKQFDYLKFKISLFKKAFPNLPGFESITPRKDINSFRWRSNNMYNSYMTKIQTITLEEALTKLTPFGWCLYYLDDGYLCNSGLGISTTNKELQLLIQKELSSYGIKSNISSKAVTIQSKEEIIKFLNNFIKPYLHIIPKCMHYKSYIKI
ncbi:MAG: hypothetical protein WC346_05675 [Methanogenium sp.]|jgi:hypothetical protein